MVRGNWRKVAKTVLVFVCGVMAGLVAQPLERPKELPTRFLRDALDATRQFSTDVRIAEAREKIELELARLEWEIAATNAFHEFARSVWVASEKFRRSPKDPQSRGQYAQALGIAYSQYAQAISTAYSSWMQARGQTFQRCQQELGTTWGTLQSSLSQSLQRAQQGIQQLTKAPEPVSFSELVKAQLPVFNEPEVEFRRALEEATSKFVKELKEVTAAYFKEAGKSARPDADVDEIDSALRKANRKWFEAALDALENYRRECHAILRKYRAKLEGE